MMRNEGNQNEKRRKRRKTITFRMTSPTIGGGNSVKTASGRQTAYISKGRDRIFELARNESCPQKYQETFQGFYFTKMFQTAQKKNMKQ